MLLSVFLVMVARWLVGVSNKMTLRQWGHASFKAGAFSTGEHGVVGNNRTANTWSKQHWVFWKQSKIKCNV